MAKTGIKQWTTVCFKWNLKHKYVNEKTANDLSEFVKKNHIDIIHSNTSVINIGALISRKSGVPHVWHIREFGDLDFHMYPLMNAKTYYAEMNKGADKFICISKAIAQHYKQLDEEKKVVIYNGVDSQYKVLHKLHNDNIVRFLIAGRVSPEKGQEEALSACEILIKKGINNFELYIAGAGEYKGHISRELENKVKFLGVVHDMPALREKMDVELVCSRAEAFGRVTIEAMMASMPVIGSDTGGTIELIRNGKNGFLYQYGNAEDLSNKMISLMDKNVISKLGSYAYNYAKDKFAIERCVNEIVEVYSKLLGGKCHS